MTKLLCAALLLSVLPITHAQEDISKANGALRVTAEKPVGDISGMNGSVHLEDGVHAKDVETVNGAITIGRNAVVGSVESVNGGINLEEGTRARSIETVNGSVSLAENVRIEGAVTAVNGGIRLARGTTVGGTLTTANGPIKLDHASVDGDVHTKSGDIEVGAQSTVKGGILVDKGSGNWFITPRVPLIVIGSGAVVTGPLTFEREVRLHVDATAKTGPIKGVKPIKVSQTASLPDRDVEK